MIALPGLTIATGRHDVARSILQTFSKYGEFALLRFEANLACDNTSVDFLANGATKTERLTKTFHW